MTRRAAAIAALIVVGCLAGVPDMPPHAVQAAPMRAPDFRLPLLAGGTISLAALKGRPAVLLFWAPW